MKRKLITAIIPALLVLSSLAAAQQTFVVKPLVEKKVTELPSGELFWRIDNFETKEQAQEAVGPMGLVAEAKGKVWLFTLGPAGVASKGGKQVAEIGPIPGSMQRSTSCGSTKQAVLQAVSPPYTLIPVRRRFTSSVGS